MDFDAFLLPGERGGGGAVFCLMELVDCRVDGRVAFLEMRGSKLNCLSGRLCREMVDAFASLASEDIFAIVLRAPEGSRVWSAGHDISELPKRSRDPLSYSVPMEHLLRAVEDARVPVIALVEGGVWGGACDLCTVCDMIVADENATFAITPAKIGIPYNASGLMHFVNAMSLNKAKEMFFTASPITAQDAYNMGFVNYVAPSGKLMEVLNEKLLDKMRGNSVLAMSAIKRQFSLIMKARASLSAERFERMQAWRRAVYDGDDYEEGIRAFFEKRPPAFKGRADELDLILKNNTAKE